MKALGNTLDSLVDEFNVNTQAKVNKGIRVAIIKTWGDIIKQTPVDEGRARGNWFIDVRPTSKVTMSKDNTKGANYVVSKTVKFNFLKNNLFLFNNLPYISKLEYGGYVKNPKKGTYNKRTKKYEIRSINGYSKLAPKGMVRLALMNWDNVLRNSFRGL